MHIMPTSDIQGMAVATLDTTKVLAKARQQAEDRRFDDVLIVDVDAHHYETDHLREIVEYIDDPVLRQLGQSATAFPTGVTSFLPPPVGFQDMGGRVTRYVLRKTEGTPASDDHRDVLIARRWMDAIGIDYICLFPTPMLVLGLHPSAEVEAGLARAYNRWLTERVTPGDPRIKTMLCLPFNDPEAAYRTVKELGDKPGVVGFMVTSPRYRPVHDNAYVKTYALIEEMGKPLAFHAAYNWNDGLLSTMNRFIGVHALGFPLYNMVHMINWVVNGMPERFPRLRLMWIEAGLAWVPFLMHRLDNEYRMRSSECPALKRLPSEYMRDMFYSSQPMEMPSRMEELEHMFKMVNAETQLLYASDYPHWDMDLPSTIWDLPFLDERAKRNILGENAMRLFNLDVSARFPNGLPGARA